MGRRKQVRPRRSGGIAVERQVPETELKEEDNDGDPKLGKFFNPEEPFYVEIDKSLMVSEEHHLDISEILLLNVNVNQEFVGCKLTEELFMDPNLFLRFKSINVNAHLGRMKLGHWPALSEKNTCLEFLMRSNVEGVLKNLVMLSGIIDGTGEGVTGLVHLCSLKYFALRPIFAVELSDSLLSVRIRVEILSNLFDQCESLLDNTRHPWKKSVVNVMTWLRPEVVTSETRYGCSSVDGDSFPTEQVRFEVSRFYEAIKPSKQAPMLEDELPDMVPELRPYQRRAAYWMVQREKAGDEVFNGNATTCAVSPLCVPICLIDTPRRIYYNPFSGNVSLDAKCSSAYVSGGILADEMGLGKTIELLACVLANQMPSSEVPVYLQTEKIPRKSFSRLKRERVECLCGAVAESFKYEGLWVQCDVCDAWQHADCVGYAPERRNRRSVDRDKWQIGNSSRKRKSRKKEIELVEMDGEFTCQTCTALIQATEPAVATGATLIVCPTPILSQWHSEILRHTKKGALKTCVYEGVRSTSFSDVPAVSIDDLLNADIVLTTYDVLKEDLPHDSERHEGDRRFMRFMKRYPVIPTLLTRVLWWRVCLDEAQMVEGSAAAATELALRLHAKNRWCITGTPIQRELDDLYGLLRFLQSSPFDVFRWWSDVISGPYERGDAAAIRFTHDFFKQLMWRSSKSHVWDELELPPQEECISWLSFSPVEQHFYRRQHETCVDDARMVLESFNKEKNSDVAKSDSSVQPFITASEAAKLFNSLLKLRQACCHPQVGSSGLRSWQKSPMTMEEILSMLIGKTKLEGEDALRKIVVALNGLAGIAMIKKDTSEAVSLYREALNLVEENADDFRLDPLLDIHIHHNLAEASSIFPEACDAVEMEKAHRNSPEELNSSAHIERLKTSCEDLKQKYLTVYNSKLSVARQEFGKLYEQVCDGFLKRKIQQATWWLDALHRIDEAEDLSRSLFQKIGEALSSGNLNNKRSRASAGSFGSITSLKYYIQTGLDALYESRSTLLDRLLELDETMENPTEADIVLVRYCRNCNSDSDGPVCTHCELDEVFRVYEARLFRLNKSNNGETVMSAEEAVNLQKKKSALNQFYWSLSRENDRIPDFSSSEDHKDDGKKRDAAEKVMTSKSPSDLEIMLTIIRNVSKGFFSGRETISTSRNHLDLLQAMRKEYAVARSLAIAQAQVLRAHDELKMATSRLRLRDRNEDENAVDALSPEEVEIASVENSSEKFVALDSLCRIRGKLRYLMSLEESIQKARPEEGASDRRSNVSEFDSKAVVVVVSSCPICHEQLGVQKMVFQCGHFTCCTCFVAMTEGKKYEGAVMLCPVCRQASEFGNIALADDDSSRRIHRDKDEAYLTVRGSYSTKIEAVTRRILWIGESDPGAKILVFSSWNDVLDVLQHALSANGITYTRMKGGRKSHTAISLFRGGAKVLLLLIQHGANGLNLLEARHVLLVEPLLNPAAEAQAIGRVHRIGQRHKTLVHRFVVKNSVEESIYKMNKSRNDGTGSFISGNRKNQDQPRLTLADVESLFRIAAASESDAAPPPPAQRRELPPSVAAAVAAEERRMDNLRGGDSS